MYRMWAALGLLVDSGVEGRHLLVVAVERWEAKRLSGIKSSAFFPPTHFADELYLVETPTYTFF
jgi:hypothetical protein